MHSGDELRDLVTVVIPSIPPRAYGGRVHKVSFIRRAIESVLAQDCHTIGLRTPRIESVIDHERRGAGPTRHRALMRAQTPWVAFLDDDDEFLPQHVRRCYEHALDTGADYVYPWFEVVGGDDPFPQHFGREFDPADPVQTTVTTFVRTALAQSVGFEFPLDPKLRIGGHAWGEDYEFTRRCVAAGAKVVHLPERTWRWHHHGANTSGRPDRW